MNNFNRKNHWEKIYRSKKLAEMSWFQPEPIYSLEFIRSINLSKSAKIIDIGGGDSYFIDHLLKMNFQDITVLDISEMAIERAKKRLGNNASRVKWMVGDITEFKPNGLYDFWHDRAVLHFLTMENEISKYVNILIESMAFRGYVLIGTFSDQGPEECSGIKIKQYSESSMINLLKKSFTKLNCETMNHKTPSGSIQNFIFCSFRKEDKSFDDMNKKRQLTIN